MIPIKDFIQTPRILELKVPGYSRQLDDEQKRGVAYLYLAKRALLADPIGFGKTIEGVGVLKKLFDQKKIKRVLVICPKSARHQWREEAKRAGIHGLLLDAAVAVRQRLIQRGKVSMMIATQPAVTKDVAAHRKTPPDCILIDESTYYKNARSAAWRAVYTLSRIAKYVFLLSGQPIENKLSEIYAQVELARPGTIGSVTQFESRYCNFTRVPIRRGTKVYHVRMVTSYKNEEEFLRLVSPHFLYRTEEDVGMKKAKIKHITVEVDLTEEQRRIYDEKERELANEPVKSKGDLFKAVGVLLRAAGSARFYGGRSSAKVRKLCQILKKTDVLERGVMIYTHYYVMLDHIRDALDKMRLPRHEISGRESGHMREIAQREFNSGKCKILLVTDAGGIALNLQGGSAIIFVDRPWSPKRCEQILGRLRRRGQKRESVVVYTLVARNTRDEYVSQVLSRKERVMGKFYGVETALKGQKVKTIQEMQLDGVEGKESVLWR